MRSAQVPVRATLELVGDETPSPEQSPEDIIHDRQRIARLHHHLAALSPVKRIAFVLSVVEGMAVEEIAAMMGSSVFTTKSRIYWAGRALRARARKDALLRDLLVDEPEGDE
jgi:DNA-directed RNA polymerase specialized sigma24 family protein